MQTRKRLSFKRTLITLVVLMAILYGCFLGWKKLQNANVNANLTPWFASYIDVTATPQFGFEQSTNVLGSYNVVLSFIVSSKTDPCEPSWGGYFSLDEASAKLDLDRRIARFRQQDGNVAVSFGGLLNDELAINCTDEKKLETAYRSVIERYKLDTIDLDIEGNDLKNISALNRRFKVISKLQKQMRSENKQLAVWLTLPVSTHGLTEEGTNGVVSALESDLDLAGVNVMTMDFGSSRKKGQSMSEAAISALNETHRQISVLFRKSGTFLNEESVWKKIGATVMIGQNDISGEIFGLEDADNFNKFVNSVGISRVSIWSGNRDISCGENYTNLNVVSDSCSGVKQEKFGFSNILKRGFEGQMSAHAASVTTKDIESKQKADDPSKSPYQIWAEDGVYLEGTKVVWHQSVYQAKWWTKGDAPDDPVLQAYETPWQLIGPVLPGEKPIPQPTMPPGSYPEWVGTEIYDAGQIVLFKGVPFQAKWWTEGDSPAAAASNPDSSPWVILTQKQVSELLKEIK